MERVVERRGSDGEESVMEGRECWRGGSAGGEGVLERGGGE